jgi:import receptor subunit TOM20
VELIVIYQKTVPEEIFKLVMDMTNLDVKNRIEGYSDAFPPKAMNVAVDTVDVPDGSGNLMRKKVLIVTKDFDAGEVIYKEHPAVNVLDFDLQAKGTHCTHCLRHIQTGMAIKPPSDRLDSVFCSKDCQVKSKVQSQNLLFGLDSPLPRELAPDMSPDATKQRDTAQAAFVDHIKKNGKNAVLLVARFIARQVAAETAKMLPISSTPPPPSDAPEADGGEYTLYDHIERLRYLQVVASEEEVKLLAKVLATAVPGLDQFVTDERHATLLGKMAYNAYGVCFGGGRDDKPPSAERPEDVEKTRTPYGTSKQVGSGLYLVAAYAAHSCAPSARPSFSNGTSELHLIANHAMKKGDEITVSYVDVTQHPDETPIDARRRRRMELARGWRFACACTRCTSEAAENPASAEGEISRKDESKTEESVIRVQAGEGASLSFLDGP